MYIKNIKIAGFRSYKLHEFEQDLHEGHNVVVGRNGSGKSNFFAAVQFVLSEKFSDLRPDDRKALFHVGGGTAAYSAYVEIVFDNSEKRLIIPGHESSNTVTIRRTLGLKQDEHRVNDRKMSLQEVRNLLESAGFSSSNPYNIVEQGKIQNLANMSEASRYQLLKEVAGTRVYETRRAQSEEILAGTTKDLARVDDSIRQLDDRLNQLEAETKELRQFQESDKKRRGLEYAIYNTEKNVATAKLLELDSTWHSATGQAKEASEQESQLENEAQEAQMIAERCAARIAELEAQRKGLEKERAALSQRKAKIEYQNKDVTEALNRDKRELTALTNEERELAKTVSSSEAELATKSKALDELQKKADVAKRALQTDTIKLEGLQAKRGRKAQFSNKADRDKWLTNEIRQTRELIQKNKEEITRVEREIEGLNASIAEQERQVKDLGNKSKSSESEASKLATQLDTELKKKEELGQKRREMWKEINHLEEEKRNSLAAMDQSQRKYDRAVKYEIRQGFQSLQECLDEMNDPSVTRAVHGQVVSLMTVENGFETAIDVTMGNAMFNIVVDSFEVSAKILKYMNSKQKPGRITFFPLDTCKGERRNDIPKTSESSLLLDHVQFDKKFKTVFQELLGRTIVCRDMETAAAVMREKNCDTVTRDGDQIGRKGGVTGGFVDRSISKLNAVAAMRKAQNEVESARTKITDRCNDVSKIEQAITDAEHKIDAARNKQKELGSDTDRTQARSVEEQARRNKVQVERLERSKTNTANNQADLQQTVKNLEAELGSEFRSSLTAEESSELERLSSVVGQNRTASDKQMSELTELRTRVEILSSTVRNASARLVAVRDRKALLERKQPGDAVVESETAAIQLELNDLESRAKAIEKAIDEQENHRQRYDQEAADKRSRVVTSKKAMQDKRDSIDRAHNERALLLQKKEEAQGKIRKLGVVPANHEDFEGKPMSELLRLLKSTNDELKRFSGVNKKALEQYTEMENARSGLHVKRNELKKELESIQDLMTKLDEDKGEAIERTFKQVAFNFGEVFGELVHADGATAKLELVANTDKKAQEKYMAVRTIVCFGIGEPTAEIGQLSGGQKSLVALALIFAIQKCDPAPFYLFDEIDAALDAGYRTSVAAMIKKQSEECQFITATFKEEMLEVADHVYGIFFHNRVSTMKKLKKSEGATILRQAAMDERSDRKRQRAEDEEGGAAAAAADDE